MNQTRLLTFICLLIMFSCGEDVEEKSAYQPYIALKFPINEGVLKEAQPLRWEGLDYGGKTLKYDLYLGVNQDQMWLALDNLTETEVCCSDLSLAEEQEYVWKVVAKNPDTQKESEVWRFTYQKQESPAPINENSIASIYSSCDYHGSRIDLMEQSYDLGRIIEKGGADNANSSVKIKYGYNLTMYKDDDFKGDYLVKANDDDCLDSDNFIKNASSYIVQKTPVWKMITLVLTKIEMDADGTHYSYTMSAGRKNAYVETAQKLPQIFKEWSKNQAVTEMDVVVVTDPVTQMQPYGNGGYYPHTAKIKGIMDKYVADNTYGSLFLCIDMGPVPKGSNWVGLGMGPTTGTKGATYACMAVTGAGAWVHEWLHGAGSWMRNKLPHLDVPDPHENGKFGYTSDVTPSWDIWYQALLCGDELERDGKPAGYTGECWKFGGPNSK